MVHQSYNSRQHTLAPVKDNQAEVNIAPRTPLCKVEVREMTGLHMKGYVLN